MAKKRPMSKPKIAKKAKGIVRRAQRRSAKGGGGGGK